MGRSRRLTTPGIFRLSSKGLIIIMYIHGIEATNKSEPNLSEDLKDLQEGDQNNDSFNGKRQLHKLIF
jgi:hypothetical protein